MKFLYLFLMLVAMGVTGLQSTNENDIPWVSTDTVWHQRTNERYCSYMPPFPPPKVVDSTKPLGENYIVVAKEKALLYLIYEGDTVAMYAATMGPTRLKDKMMEGDRNTPEGEYTIVKKYPTSMYNKFMLLSYPTDSNWVKFKRAKDSGLIPQNAKIGSAIGIHGIWPMGDDMIRQGVMWTDGCVAIQNADIDELYQAVKIGTHVYIYK